MDRHGRRDAASPLSSRPRRPTSGAGGRTFPEYGRDALFTERIPFRETRDYVKILTRNRALYEGLYRSE